MAILNILHEGDDVLRKKSRIITDITSKILTLINDMGETLIKADGCGLAAPQVGILRRVFIINDSENDQPHIVEFINPKIVAFNGHQENLEGCLSIPGKYGITSRPETVTVEATNRFGKKFSYTGTNMIARALCHENDHLDGILYIDNAIRMLTQEELDADE